MMPSKPRRVAHALLAVSWLALLPIAAPRAEAAAVSTFDLPAEPLADSLRAVARATHANVAFDADAVAGVEAPTLHGTMTAAEAVAALLSGTALRYERVDPHTIRVERNSGASLRTDGATARGDEAPPESPSGAQSNQSSGAGAAPIELSEVVVTGTHIHGASTPSPTITLTRTDIERSGYTDVGDLIRSLPENFSAGNNPQTSVANTPVAGNGNVSGGSSPNLLGLGPTSTLTLVNGHRLGQDGTLGAGDISIVPLVAVERVDVVTDSSSAAYGSDAVAGVVNFILRKDYDGAETTGLLGTATEGGGYERDVSQLLGHTWRSGGALLAYEHETQDAVWSYQRAFTATAPSPSTLLPESSRDSAYLSAHQDIDASIALFADGLYTSRQNESYATYPPTSPAGTLTGEADVRQYLADFGVNALFNHGWKGTVYTSIASERAPVSDERRLPGAAAFMPYLQATYTGTTRVAEASADGPIADLGTDAVRAAVGGGYRKEGLDGTGQSVFEMSRADRYAFAELNVPLAATAILHDLNRLDLNISGRYDGYTDIGGKVVPKAGLTFGPIPSIALHATWSEAYRAPTLFSLYSTTFTDVLVLPDPLSPTRTSLDLVRFGANPQLRPETARTWTTSLEWRPQSLSGTQAELSYFDIRYGNRVLSLTNYDVALTDPAFAPLVIRDPSLAVQQSVIDSGGFNNFSGHAYVPSAIGALVDARYLNVAEQHLRGVDLVGSYSHELRYGTLHAFVNGAYLQLRQRVTSESPEQELAGRTFNPPRFRGRAGLTWGIGGWTATGVVNWIGSSLNTYVPGTPSVGSWTSIDTQLRYTAPDRGVLAGLEVSLSVQNLLDRDPPFVQYFGNPLTVGYNYDTNNFSPMGRFVSLQIKKAWFPKRERE